MKNEISDCKEKFYSSSKWKKARKIALKLANFKCSVCDSTKNLHVHHTKYRYVSDKLKDLEVLCIKCHIKRHPKMKRYYRAYFKRVRRLRYLKNREMKNRVNITANPNVEIKICKPCKVQPPNSAATRKWGPSAKWPKKKKIKCLITKKIDVTKSPIVVIRRQGQSGTV